MESFDIFIIVTIILLGLISIILLILNYREKKYFVEKTRSLDVTFKNQDETKMSIQDRLSITVQGIDSIKVVVQNEVIVKFKEFTDSKYLEKINKSHIKQFIDDTSNLILANLDLSWVNGNAIYNRIYMEGLIVDLVILYTKDLLEEAIEKELLEVER